MIIRVYINVNATFEKLLTHYEMEYGVIPYQFTKVLHMTPSELDEIQCVSSPGDHMCPKGISPPSLVWLLRNGLLNFLLFVIFSVPFIIQSIITLAFFVVLKNQLLN